MHAGEVGEGESEEESKKPEMRERSLVRRMVREGRMSAAVEFRYGCHSERGNPGR